MPRCAELSLARFQLGILCHLLSDRHSVLAHVPSVPMISIIPYVFQPLRHFLHVTFTDGLQRHIQMVQYVGPPTTGTNNCLRFSFPRRDSIYFARY
jgi:hypothetical protein